MAQKNPYGGFRDELDMNYGAISSYAVWLRKRAGQLKDKIQLSELIKLYERETGGKITADGASKTLKRLFPAFYFRAEQVYWCPPTLTRHVSMVGAQGRHRTNQITSSHNHRFSIRFAGSIPPELGKRSPWGRTGKSEQIIIEGENLKFQIFRGRMLVYIHNPEGETPEQQVREARAHARLELLALAKRCSLKVEPKDLETLANPHHVLDKAPALDEAYKKSYTDEQKAEIRKEIGVLVDGDGSHPELEIEGITGRCTVCGQVSPFIPSTPAAKGLYWHLWLAPKNYESLISRIEKIDSEMNLKFDLLREQQNIQSRALEILLQK